MELLELGLKLGSLRNKKDVCNMKCSYRMNHSNVPKAYFTICIGGVPRPYIRTCIGGTFAPSGSLPILLYAL